MKAVDGRKEWLIKQGIGASLRATNKYKLSKLIEQLGTVNGALVHKQALLLTEITGCLVSDVLNIKRNEFDALSGRVLIRQSKSDGCSLSHLKLQALEYIREHRKNSALLAHAFELYCKIDRMDRSDLEHELTVPELLFMGRRISEAQSTIIERYIPADILWYFQDTGNSNYIFDVKRTGANRAQSLNQPLSRQAVWYVAEKLPFYEARKATSYSLREPLTY